MELQGKIVAVLPEVSGTSKSGKEWKKREYVIESIEAYPKQVCFQLFNDRVDQYPMTEGQEVKISIDIESREYNGRWYTQVSAYKVEYISEAPQSASSNNQSETNGMQTSKQNTQQQSDSNDLPF